MKTYLYMYRYGRNLELLYETPGQLSVDQAPPKHNLKAFVAELYKEGRMLLTEKESKRFLVNYGIPTVKPYPTKNLEEALSLANSVGYPVVLKIVSSDIPHKSDVGGVVTGISSDRELKQEYGRLIKRVQKKVPQASISGISVQKMVEKVDYELILGMKKDKDFGSVILFGMGGIGVEMFQDFSIGSPVKPDPRKTANGRDEGLQDDPGLSGKTACGYAAVGADPGELFQSGRRFSGDRRDRH